jgi:hypothetical protein
MAFDDRICWLVQAGARARYAEDFVTGSIVSVGWDWPGITDLAAAQDAEVFLALEALGRRKPADDLRDLRIFSSRMGEGDVLVVPDPPAEDLLFGQVTGDYSYRADGGAHRHTRPVRWFGRLGLDQAEALLVATALRERQPIRRLPEQLRWQRLAGEVDDVLGRPADDIRQRKPARTVRSRSAAAPRSRASTAAPKPTPIPERICPACGLMRSPSLFADGDDVCRDCA